VNSVVRQGVEVIRHFVGQLGANRQEKMHKENYRLKVTVMFRQAKLHAQQMTE